MDHTCIFNKGKAQPASAISTAKGKQWLLHTRLSGQSDVGQIGFIDRPEPVCEPGGSVCEWAEGCNLTTDVVLFCQRYGRCTDSEVPTRIPAPVLQLPGQG